MNRQQKIAKLKAIFQGKGKISDLIPDRFKIMIRPQNKGGTSYFINDQPANLEEFTERSHSGDSATKIKVSRI